MKKVLKIKNLDCPVCAGELQEELEKIDGIKDVRVDYLTQTIVCEYDREEMLQQVIQRTNSFEEVKVLEEQGSQTESHKKEWLQLLVSLLLAGIGCLYLFVRKGKIGEIFGNVCMVTGYLVVGYPVLMSTFNNLRKGKIFDENFLMTVASVGAMVLGEVVEGFAVLFLYQLGELLQSIAVGASRRSVKELMQMKTDRAVLLKDGQQISVSPEQLKIDDTVLVKTGEKVPTDGILLGESATLDTKALTGEFELKTVKRGEEILSGSINAGNAFELKVIRRYEDSAVGKILELMENASVAKATPEKFITKFAKIYTPIVCICALILAVCFPLVGGLVFDGRLYFKDASRWITAALTFLVVSCPCALVISVPLTYFLGLGISAKAGALIKGATYLETLSKVETVAFDKTGTLTKGEFTILSKHFMGEMSEEKILAMVAGLERYSSHPLAKAFQEIPTHEVFENVHEIAGQGLVGKTQGKELLVGNERLLRERGVSFLPIDTLYTVIYVAFDGEFIGFVEVGDILREETLDSIKRLKELGITHTAMLTGDREVRAKRVAQEVGIQTVYAELLPDQKLEKAKEMQRARTLLYVGDGINDAPVMIAADCSVSMGKLGSAAAIEASDVVLISENLKVLPKVIEIAKKTKRIVFQNIIFSILMKIAFMILGIIGMPLYMAVFADVGVMLLAICNAFRVRKLKK